MCEVDRSNRSTGVNLSKKQSESCCFLLCLWFQVQSDTSDLVYTLCGVRLKIRRLCTCVWDWTYSFLKRYYKNFAFYEYRRCQQVEGTRFVSLSVWDRPHKCPKILSPRHSSVLMMSSSLYLLLESECSFTNKISSSPNTKFSWFQVPTKRDYLYDL